MRYSFKTGLPAWIAFFLTTACLGAGFPVQEAEGDIIPFAPERWDLANAKVVDHLERKALMGAALLKDVEFEDGVIECDIAMKAGIRSYPGLIFRVQSQEDYERVYLRPHRSPLYDDAVQYVPAFHGVDGWQLYNGPGLTARAVIPTDRWVHVRIEVLGTQARIYLDNAPQPVLVIGDLKRGKTKGGLGLTTMADGNSFFSNFSFRQDRSLPFPRTSYAICPALCLLHDQWRFLSCGMDIPVLRPQSQARMGTAKTEDRKSQCPGPDGAAADASVPAQPSFSLQRDELHPGADR